MVIGYHPRILAILFLLTVPAPVIALGQASESLANKEELSQLIAASRYDELLSRGEVLLAELRRDHPEGSLAEAELLDLMVHACYRSNRVMDEQAVVMARRAVALKEAARGPESVAVAQSLIHLANLLMRRWEIEESLPHFERAEAILSAAGPEHEAGLAILLRSEGVAYRRLGDHERAMALYRQALEIQERRLGAEHPDLAATLNNIALVHSHLGDYLQAKSDYERALLIREAHYGPDHEWVAETLNNLASVLGYLGEYDAALRAQERAVGIFASQLGMSHQRYWWAKLNLGIAYLDMGDHQGALPICEEVLAAISERYGPEHPENCYVLDALASCHFKAGDYAQALATYDESLRIGEAEFGRGNIETADTIEERGRCLVELGRLDEASQTLYRSLAIREEAFSADSIQLCDLLHRLADLHLRRGEFEQAQALASRSGAILLSRLGQDHPLLAEAHLLAARALWATGRPDEALEDALLAEEISRRHLQTTMRVLSEERALDLALSVLKSDERGARVGQVWNSVIHSRAAVLDEYTARNRNLNKQVEPRTVALADSSLALRERLANLTLRGPGWEEEETYRRLLQTTGNELDRIERRLSLASTSHRQADAARRTGLADVRAALGEGDTLLAFVRYRRSNPATHADSPVESYRAFVLTGPGAEPMSLELGTAEQIDALVSAWRDQAGLGTRQSATVARRDGGERHRGLVRVARDAPQRMAAYHEAATALRERIWDSLATHISGADRVFLVLDSSLHLVNFSSLPVDDARFLVESGPLLHTLVTERSLGKYPNGESPGCGLLAVGDPDFLPAGQPVTAAADSGAGSSETPCLTLGDLEFHSLPSARNEVRQLQEIWNAMAESPADRAMVLLGADATEQTFKSSLGSQRVLHLATHGFILSDACLVANSLTTRWYNPLALSGLALGGANRWQQATGGDNDGILTSEEVAALDLRATEWAVLSACDTGLGNMAARGEGVFGLGRAFTLAGAHTVIMSLWSIGDDTSSEWMTALYRARFQDGKDTAQAVRAASLAVLSSRRTEGRSVHPHYWAGFVAAGDWH